MQPFTLAEQLFVGIAVLCIFWFTVTLYEIVNGWRSGSHREGDDHESQEARA